MVSHALEPTSHSLSIRSHRAPSVASTTLSSSTRRRHRHGRSHAGSASYQPQNEFPVFTHTGDVEIIIVSGRKEQRYLLHRLILAQCSAFFEAGTSDEWSRVQGASAGPSAASSGQQTGIPNGVESGALVHKRRWRYELDWGNGAEETPMLVQRDAPTSLFGGDHAPRPTPARNKPPASQANFFRSMTNFSALNMPQTVYDPADDLLRAYDNLFRVFYNYPPALDPLNIANAYVECKGLLQLADMYDALEVIGPRVDHHLLRFQSRLWKQIAKYPPSYLKLGYLARSKAIFSEAMVHVVGQWPLGASQLRGQVPAAVLELIEDKLDELEELKGRVEAKLFRLTLTTSRGERVTPSNSWTDWMAMSLFRQWFAENTTPPRAPILKDTTANANRGVRSSSGGGGGSSSGSGSTVRHQQQPHPPPSPGQLHTGRVFRLLGAGGAAYLGHAELKRFLKLNPDTYNRDALKKFERRMNELKNLARDAVKPLMRNFLELDLGREGSGLPYLTCTRIEERDFPWEE